ncbi:hypothetical protein IV203_036837 [Nitzschia inconspicua]|uniref:Uncharacterized protein n=1 Tax=Nitzschia inconspicua TaxID=303405 RepID=A0A9K3PW80_9STRA|nr:hypothetical protein IV203_036837 [Nitzschia inconspicua]
MHTVASDDDDDDPSLPSGVNGNGAEVRANNNGSPDQESVVRDDTTTIGALQRYMEINSQQDPRKKTRIMLTLCFAYIPDFTTDIFPYNHKVFVNSKRQHKPSRAVLKKEIQRRNPLLKGYKNRPTAYLLLMLAEEKFKLPNVDMDYLQRFLLEYKTDCENKIMGSTSDSCCDPPTATTTTTTTTTPTSTANATATPRMTTDDRLRLIEAFHSEKAKRKMLVTQGCLNLQESDARHSVIIALGDYFDTVSRVFNDETWVPTLTSLPDLHPDLADARELPLKEYRTTRATVKEIHTEMTNHLRAMVMKWEQSGNGGQQRSDDDEDWGTFDPDLVVDGGDDDRRNFLPEGNNAATKYYLLYFWHKLDKDGYLQMNLVKLPNRVKSSTSLTVSQSATKRPKTSDRQPDPVRQPDVLAARTMNARVGAEERRIGNEEVEERRIENDEIEERRIDRENEEVEERHIRNQERHTGNEETEERRIRNEDRHTGNEGFEERRIRMEERRIGIEERRIGMEERRLRNEEINTSTKLRMELTGKILQLDREMEAIGNPSNSLYGKLNKAKRKYEQLLDSSEGIIH